MEFNTIQSIKQSVSIPVVANGDIDSVEKARDVLGFTQADGIMIGRRALGAPWFLSQVAGFMHNNKLIPEPDIEQQGKIVLSHLEEIYSFYGVCGSINCPETYKMVC